MSSGAPAGDEPSPPRLVRLAALRPETLLFLLGLALVLVFLALEPYLSYAVFGSDTGEYYRLTSDLLATGHLPLGSAYGGWGTAYPDFPGIFLLAGAGSGALGLSAFTALTVIVPVVAMLSVFPLFLLFRRLYPHDTIALLGAAIASVAMPRLFSIAHPAPLALGDFLGVAALWMFLETRKDTRWYLPLALTGGALIVTHHLSSYFFAVGAVGGLLLLELWRPGLWSRRFPTRELVFLGGFLTATFVYWFFGTTSFVASVILPALPHAIGATPALAFGLVEAIGLAAVVAAGALIALRRGRFHPRRVWVRLPTDRSVVRDLLLILAGVFGGVGLLLVVALPGTTQTTSAAAILWFTPVLVLALFASGSRRTTTTARLGPFAITWLFALGLMAILALAAGGLPNTAFGGYAAAIPPSRFAEYLFLPLGLLLGVGLARLVTRTGDRYGRRAFVAASLGVVLLLAANAAIVYPPQSDLGGFEEGLTHGDAGLWLWIGLAEPRSAAVASDHRLSSMIFGFDGNPATWSSTPELFTGSNWSVAAAELRASDAPLSPARPIDLVAIDSVMYGGVALDPAGEAVPLSAEAIGWFGGLPFVLLYENGLDVVYLVDASYLGVR
ncbi:MAG TPA: hypothetical protein VMC82_02545 [Thermoplasmata archaeon]|nr:hypothetical protein [Thermoplasmata archaeon]